MEFVDPKNDIAFKKIFGNENKKGILISFLNAVLDFTGEQTIVKVKLKNPYHGQTLKNSKKPYWILKRPTSMVRALSSKCKRKTREILIKEAYIIPPKPTSTS